MGFFDDKKFEELDWMSQMTETIESKVNEVLEQIPDRTELNFKTIASIMEGLYGGNMQLTTARAISYCLHVDSLPVLSYHEKQQLQDCFKLEVTDDFKIDFENDEMVGQIFLVKTVSTIDDEILQRSLGEEGLRHISQISWNSSSFGRANEVMELIGGLEKELKNRSQRRKTHALRKRLDSIFKKNEWRIRDTALANNVGVWISRYIAHGDLAAFSNFCKLKVMTHQNMPIYSIEEQE